MAVHAAGGLFEGTIRSASHLTETVNKTNVLFGDSAKIITEHANAMADVYSEPKQQILDVTDNFALMGKEIGLSSDEAAKFGVKISQMALDARSLGDIETAAQKIQSGLAGQSKPLRSLGIFINAATVKEEAARMGMQPAVGGQLSEGQKIKARASLIENSEFMRKAAGDLARTFNETEGQTRAFWGALSNLGTSIGQELNPAWNKLLLDLNSGLASLKGYFEDNKSTIRGWGNSVVEGFETAKTIWRNLPDILEIALLGADQKMENARAKIETWATKIAVAIEKPFLKGAQSAGDYFKKAQDLVQTGASYGAAGLEKGAGAAQSVANFGSQTWDAAVEALARKADVTFRPVRDLANFAERKAGAGDYKQMSIEEDILRLKGAVTGTPQAIGRFRDYLKIFQDVAGESIKAKPTDFTSSLIDKANKHLADTMAQNTDISSKAIAAVEERMRKREADRLADLAQTAWEKDFMEGGIITPEETRKAQIDFEKDFMAGGMSPQELQHEKVLANKAQKAWEEDFMAGGKATKFFRKGGGTGGSGDEDEDSPVLSNKRKHQKSIMDTASFAEQFQTAQLGGDVPDKQLTELQRIREYEAQNAANLEKMLTRNGMAVFA